LFRAGVCFALVFVSCWCLFRDGVRLAKAFGVVVV